MFTFNFSAKLPKNFLFFKSMPHVKCALLLKRTNIINIINIWMILLQYHPYIYVIIDGNRR